MTVLDPDPLEEHIRQTLERLDHGSPPREIEVAQVDVKEEPGRRGPDGSVQTGHAQNEAAAVYLAQEMACMANTPGGGAIIVGISDDGDRTGTLLNPDWLRERIWQLTQRKLTVTARPVDLDGTRILVLKSDYAIEPIYYRDRLRWRVNRSCVEIDPNSWHTERLRRVGYDWSAQPSGHTLADVDLIAVEVARHYLRERYDDTGLAEVTNADMIRRLNLVDGQGRLTNAGSLLFVETPGDGLDYIRRDVPGAGSTYRERGRSRPLIRQIREIEKACERSNRTIHVPRRRMVIRQIRAIPSRAVREAIVNAVTHRDWFDPNPTTIEHIGDHVTVTSPGGFIGGITPSNIITHPAVARYRSLAEAMASLKLAERQGAGIDLIISSMLAIGLPGPEISEIGGPYVRIGLFGGDPDEAMIDLLSSIQPREASEDVDLLLVLGHLLRKGWIDPTTASPVLQRPTGEAAAALNRISRATVDDGPVIAPVAGSPEDPGRAYRLAGAVRTRLDHRLIWIKTREGRETLILDWAQGRGRVSTAELADLADVTRPYAGRLLTDLQERGLLTTSRARKRGRGFHYLPGPTSNT